MNRRQFLVQSTAWAAGASGLLLPDVAAARTQDFWIKDRFIDIRRSQTGERARVKFYENGRYVPEAYRNLCYIMRDVVDRNQVASMDIGLFNLIWGCQEWARLVGIDDPYYQANSGHRTQRHNSRTEGAARNSYHITGQAGDGKIRGLDSSKFANMAKYYGIGGVGLYDNFVHTDTGRVRFWRGG